MQPSLNIIRVATIVLQINWKVALFSEKMPDCLNSFNVPWQLRLRPLEKLVLKSLLPTVKKEHPERFVRLQMLSMSHLQRFNFGIYR